MMILDISTLKSITFDRSSRDFRAEYDGVLVGFYATYHAAETALDAFVYDLLLDGECATAAELDAA